MESGLLRQRRQRHQDHGQRRAHQSPNLRQRRSGYLSTDPLGFTTVTLYDKNGNVTETIDARGDSSLQAFDKDNRLTLSTDPNGHTVLQAYNQAGGMTSSIDGNGNTTTYYLDKAQLATAIVNGEGFTTLQSFDKDGRLTKSVDADNFTVSTAFDQNGQVIQMTDGAGHATAQQYDPAGRLTKTTDGAGATRLSLYDPAGIVTASVDGNGHTTQYALDPAGRVTLTTDPNGNTMLQGYDPAGLVTLTTDGNGNTMQQQFDPSGLVTEVIDGGGHAQLYSFDADGRMTLSQDADGHTTQQKYDQVGNLTATIDGNGVTTGQRFDKAGLMTATIDGGGNTTLYQFDAAGNETLVADPYGHGTSYAFNKANQLTKLTDADANATSYVLDGVGNATIVIDPNMNRTTQQFDGDHQVTQQITGRMNTLSYGFDGVGRPTSSPNGSFGYNKEGQLTLASNSYGAYSLTYDDGGRVTLVTEPNSLTLSFGYDKAGNRTLVTDSLGGSETSIYDAANFLTTRTYQGQGQTLSVQFTNNAEDWNTTLARYGNGTLVATGETSSDNVGQATTILNTHGTATVDQFLNAYNNGNVTSVIGTQNGSTTTLGLTYDEDNELTVAGTTSYTFDSNGNRTGSASVTTGNELTSDATWTYTYDADGNLIQKSKGVGGTIITIGLGGGGGGGVGIPGGGETWTYGYNPQDQLTQVQHFTGPLVTLALTVDYDYDAFGNRIETTSIASGTTTVTKDAYDGWDPGQPAPTGNENFNVWAQTNASGTLTSRYLYSDRVDQQLGRIDVTAGTATIYWTLEDYQNSVRDVIDNTGALKDSIQYDAFGNITSETDPTYRGSYAWTGRELDAETDLQYNHARWYDATTGRWMTRDPLGFDAGDSNLYRYVNNAPTEATDPSGLDQVALNLEQDLVRTVGGATTDWAFRPSLKVIYETKDGKRVISAVSKNEIANNAEWGKLVSVGGTQTLNIDDFAKREAVANQLKGKAVGAEVSLTLANDRNLLWKIVDVKSNGEDVYAKINFWAIFSSSLKAVVEAPKIGGGLLGFSVDTNTKLVFVGQVDLALSPDKKFQASFNNPRDGAQEGNFNWTNGKVDGGAMKTGSLAVAGEKFLLLKTGEVKWVWTTFWYPT